MLGKERERVLSECEKSLRSLPTFASTVGPLVAPLGKVSRILGVPEASYSPVLTPRRPHSKTSLISPKSAKSMSVRGGERALGIPTREVQAQECLKDSFGPSNLPLRGRAVRRWSFGAPHGSVWEAATPG